MFGYIIVNKPEMKFKEFDVYHGYYCGLCKKLKEHYGKIGQMTLSYDMTFLVMMLTSLYEPQTVQGMTKCVAHPFQEHPTRINEITDYAAHMNVLLSYYKCRDDWEDEKKKKQLLMSKALYRKCGFSKNFYREKWKKIERLLRKLSEEEKKDNLDLDYMSGMFGQIMAEIMLYQRDEWEELLVRFGFYLGKFVYLMDAYEDIEEDRKNGTYNPFRKMYEEPDFEERCHTILTMMMAECSKAFEQLSLIDHIEILRNILYSGVWYRYEKVRSKREEKKGEEYDGSI